MYINNNQLLNNYNEKIRNFEIYVKDIFDNYKQYKNPHRGYLINFEDYENLKKIISGKNNEYNNNLSNLKCLREIEFRTSTYLFNMLSNKNKYIFINYELWKLFGKGNEDLKPIMYRINFSNILFSLDDNIGLNLWCRNTNNIIDESSFFEDYNKNCYNRLKLNNDNINKIYKQIIDNYNFENKIKNSL